MEKRKNILSIIIFACLIQFFVFFYIFIKLIFKIKESMEYMEMRTGSCYYNNKVEDN